MPSLLELRNISFGFEHAATTLFSDLSLRLAPGWCGVIGSNGTGKTTLLHLISGQLQPRAGDVLGASSVVVCPQRTDDPPDALPDFVEAHDRVGRRVRGQLGIEEEWVTRWSSLSHGERKRAQIGVALWQTPEVLALDEPTNHVDAETRAMLLRILRDFRGVGLVVSHDRELLDTLCTQCLVFEHGDVVQRPGGYSKAMEQADSDQAVARAQYEQIRREQRRLERTAAERRNQAARADSRRSKRRIGRKDHDAKARIDAARVSGKDGKAGRLQAQLEGRLRQGRERLHAAATSDRPTLGITMRGEPARAAALWRTEGETLPLGPTRTLTVPALTIRPDDRIGVRGPNGAGKSTLVSHLMASHMIPTERIVWLPQEIDRAEAASVLDDLQRMPSGRRGEVLAALHCLGSDPVRVLETEEPSPGEVRKLILAMGLARTPHLIVMDEPTNHLDLPSIECLEATLRECACALLLVSHDQRFLDALVRTSWVVTSVENESTVQITRHEAV